MTDESLKTRPSYEIVSVRPTERPAGTEGSNWYRYIIQFEGSKSIQGCRQGDLNGVTGAVEEFVAQLNERQTGKRGRVHLVPKPKKLPRVYDRSNSA